MNLYFFPIRKIVRNPDGTIACDCKDGPNCDQIGKHPAVVGWTVPPGETDPDDGTPSYWPAGPEGLGETWEGHGRGLPTGAINGFFVLDVDVKEATEDKPAKDGFASLAALEAKYGVPLPETPTVKSPTGGAHFYFKVPPGKYIKTTGGTLGPGVDIRGDGGQIIAPGSPHKNGRTYEALNDVELADAPEWLLKLVTEDAPVPRKLGENLSPLPDKTGAELESAIARMDKYCSEEAEPCIQDGNSSARLLKCAAKLCAARIPKKQRMELFRKFNARCEPPWDEIELDRAMTNAETGTVVTQITREAAIVERLARNALGPPSPKEQPAAEAGASTAEEPDPVFDLHEGGWDKDEPEIPYLVSGLIPSGTVGMLVAPGESIKSWILVSLLLAVGKGGKWLNYYEVQQGKAYYIDYESDRQEARRRLRVLQAGTAPGFVYANTDYNMHDDTFWQNLPQDGKLYVIDSLSEGSGDVDENSTLASMPLKFARRISRKTGAVFIFLHHNKKGEGNARDKIRGSSTLFNASDFVYGVDTEPASENGNIVAKIFKVKMKRAKAPKPFSVLLSDAKGLEMVGDPNAPPACEAPDSWTRRKILSALKNRPMTRTELAEAAGKQKARGLAAIKDLERDGLVVEIDRKMHLDDPESRALRIVNTARQLAGTRKVTKKTLCQLGNVLPGDVEKLEFCGVLHLDETQGYMVDDRKWAEREAQKNNPTLFNGHKEHMERITEQMNAKNNGVKIQKCEIIEEKSVHSATPEPTGTKYTLS
jgi:DNA-binding transcriptional ArsR family regulator